VNYAAARAAYTSASARTASSERLIVMLYDGAIRFLYSAAAAAREGRRADCREKLGRAQAIIAELNRSLDMSHGQIPRNLRNIYGFCSRHLIDSTLNGNPDGYEEVAKLLAELREAWEQIARAPDQAASSGA
jgi:flagellar protein FliS